MAASTPTSADFRPDQVGDHADALMALPHHLLDIQWAPLPATWRMDPRLHQRPPSPQHPYSDLESLGLAHAVVDDVDRSWVRHRQSHQRLPQTAPTPVHQLFDDRRRGWFARTLTVPKVRARLHRPPPPGPSPAGTNRTRRRRCRHRPRRSPSESAWSPTRRFRSTHGVITQSWCNRTGSGTSRSAVGVRARLRTSAPPSAGAGADSGGTP